MKTTITKLSIFSLLLLVLVSCKKDAEMPTGEFVNLKTNTATEITAVSAMVSAKAGADCTGRGVCWGKAPNPTIDDFHVANGSGKGEYTCTLTGLEPNQKYYYRAYAQDGEKYVYAQDEMNLTTKDGLPSVTTGNVSDVTSTSATCSGNVTDDGGFAVTERGICWSTNPNPTLENAQHVVAGSGTGEFSVTLNGLEGSTLYYVCAYATNSCGTRYGESVPFSTLTPPLTFTANGVTFKMIFVEGGTFTMGATSEQGSDAYDDEKPTHSVTLSSYYMGETEVTQALWQAVTGVSITQISNQIEIAPWGQGDNYPMHLITWNDCQEFVTKLNQLCVSQLNGRQFCLPTEAEWEYAARGGKNSQGYKYCGSNNLDDVAWYWDNSGSFPGAGSMKTHEVDTKHPNELGFFGMSGNADEWCSDWWGEDYYSSSPQYNPTGPSTGSKRVCRGGSSFDFAYFCRVSYRGRNSPDTRSIVGLRLSLR